MKKFILVLTLFISCSVFADAKDILKQRLDKIEGLHAQFSQTVTTADNQLVQQGKGELWLSRPHFFNWEMTEPDESALISDGKNLWIYLPDVEQVTIMSFNQAVDNRLLLLITDKNSAAWQDYNVKRNQNEFTLTPINQSGQSYKISVLPTGMLANFTIIDEDGQTSFYELSHQKMGSINKQKFTFTVPDGVTIDDQR
ncbi:outer membrane lipoprotein chaperone LolA [Orbaceae bacterium ac157xtp]